MYKEYPKGAAPAVLEELAGKIRDADGFVFVTGEYNWGIQPGLKNLTDHFLRNGSGGRLRLPAIRPAASSGVRATAWARHVVRDGHGGDFEHDRGRADFANAFRRGKTGWRGWQGAGANRFRFGRRPLLVGGSGEGAAGEGKPPPY